MPTGNKGRGANSNQSRTPAEEKQSRRLTIALALLVVVLVVVLIKNRDFWFGSDEVAESDFVTSQNSTKTSATPTNGTSAPASHTPAAKSQPTAQPTAKTSSKAEENKAEQQPEANSSAPIVATNRVVLPPMDVEVVAGDKRSVVHPGSNSMVAEITADSSRPALTASTAGMPINAAERTRLSAAARPQLRQTIETVYPLLSQHSKVQGSVILEAVIGTDGGIENLRVLSGPSILTSAAQQAVRDWHFKPYLQNGQPVETKCRVTVNFSIRTDDQAAAS
jgi:TonB family protein